MLYVAGPSINLNFGLFFFLMGISELLLNPKSSLFILSLKLVDLPL
jgi:hypothetical protein